MSKNPPPDAPRQRIHRSREAERWVRQHPGITFGASELAEALTPPWTSANAATVLRRMAATYPERMTIVQRGVYRWSSVDIPHTPAAATAPPVEAPAPAPKPLAPARRGPGRPPGTGRSRTPVGTSFKVIPLAVNANGSLLVRRSDTGDTYRMERFDF